MCNAMITRLTSHGLHVTQLCDLLVFHIYIVHDSITYLDVILSFNQIFDFNQILYYIQIFDYKQIPACNQIFNFKLNCN